MTAAILAEVKIISINWTEGSDKAAILTSNYSREFHASGEFHVANELSHRTAGDGESHETKTHQKLCFEPVNIIR